MKSKTIRLTNDHKLVDGKLYQLEFYVDAITGEHLDSEWVESVFQIGEEVALCSRTDVSPNAIRSGKDNEFFYIVYTDSGIPGNSNRNIKRHHGWRGTTNGISRYAYGRRKIISMRTLKNGEISVKVGADIVSDLS